MAAIVCLTDRRRSSLTSLLRRDGHHVYSTYTADHAVCLCVQHYVDAVVLDQDLFVETDGWSVAQSIKGVRPTVRVILVTDAVMLSRKRPKCVDVIVNQSDLGALQAAIGRGQKDSNLSINRRNESKTIQ